jgi:hypothetical protein
VYFVVVCVAVGADVYFRYSCTCVKKQNDGVLNNTVQWIQVGRVDHMTAIHVYEYCLKCGFICH